MRAGKNSMASDSPNPELRKETFMAHVITDTCKKDNLCVDSCPSEAIHPTEGRACMGNRTPALHQS